MQKKLLQTLVFILGFIPVLAGGYGAITGTDMADAALDNHFRYLSGLLFAIGIAFWSCIPRIEVQTARFRLLTVIVFVGGLFRLIGWVQAGFVSDPSIYVGLTMELIVVPLLCLWQRRIKP